MLIYLALIDEPSDQEKFLAVYDRYRKAMFNKANSILHNEQDAEDAVQDAFISIARNIKKISDPDCHRTRKFVVIITVRKAIDIYNKNKERYTVPLDEVVTYTLDEHDKPSEIGKIMECALKLPENYRTPMLLRYDQEYSIKEIAEILDETEVNIRKLLERGRKRLNKIYEEEQKKSEVD